MCITPMKEVAEKFISVEVPAASVSGDDVCKQQSQQTSIARHSSLHCSASHNLSYDLTEV